MRVFTIPKSIQLLSLIAECLDVQYSSGRFDVCRVNCPSPDAVSCPVLFCLAHFSSGASVFWFPDGHQTSAASRCPQWPSSTLALLTSRTTFQPPFIWLEVAGRYCTEFDPFSSLHVPAAKATLRSFKSLFYLSLALTWGLSSRNISIVDVKCTLLSLSKYRFSWFILL